MTDLTVSGATTHCQHSTEEVRFAQEAVLRKLAVRESDVRSPASLEILIPIEEVKEDSVVGRVAARIPAATTLGHYMPSSKRDAS